MQQDFVIYNPETKNYAFYENNEYYCGWQFGGALDADGFTCMETALQRIKGMILPSGRVMYGADPALKDCVVCKRSIMVEVEDV